MADRTPVILLSFDLEEFDIPLEYGIPVSQAEQTAVTAEGLAALLPVLEQTRAVATFFTTAHFAHQRPDLIAALAGPHEVAAHGVRHTGFTEADLTPARQALEALTCGAVRGFRSPRLCPVAPAALLAAGYEYDASANPTWVPGRYNQLRQPRTPHCREGIVVLPASVTPLFRLPLFWLTFKNLPALAVRLASAWTLRHDGYLSIYFHPWEFSDLGRYALPRYVRRPDGAVLLRQLGGYLSFLAARGRFALMQDYALETPR